EQEEPQVPPAVPPPTKVGGAASLCRMQCRGNLRNPQVGQRRFYHHLAGELHPAGAEVQTREALPPKRPDATMEVTALGPVEPPAEPGEDGVPDVAVQRGHGSGLDPALEPVPDDDVVALAELLDER